MSDDEKEMKLALNRLDGKGEKEDETVPIPSCAGLVRVAVAVLVLQCLPCAATQAFTASLFA